MIKANFERLERMYAIAVATPDERFCMRTYWCNSVGCLLGNYFKHLDMRIPEECEHFGISKNTLEFCCYIHGENMPIRHAIPAQFLTKDHALRRLRGVINYLRRREALWQDHEDMMRLSKKARRLLQQSPKKWELVNV